MKEQEVEVGGGTQVSAIITKRKRAEQQQKQKHWKQLRRKTMHRLLTILSFASFLLTNSSFGQAMMWVGAPTASEQVQVLNAVSRLIAPVQVAACDGEQLYIDCEDNYQIDIMQVEYTFLSDTHIKQQQDTKVSNSTTTIQPPQQLTEGTINKSSDSNVTNQTCPPLNNRPLDSMSLNNGTICDEQQAQKQAEIQRELALKLIRSTCHLNNNCTLDLRQQLNATSEIGSLKANSTLKLSNHKLNEACPHNRQLLEVVYKCRPYKMSRKVICRGNQLQLGCPANKKLLIGSAYYGAALSENYQEKCRFEQLQTNQRMVPDSTLANISLFNAPARDCQIQAIDPLFKICFGKQNCRLDVNPTVFGQTNCTGGLLEYIKVIYSCANQDMHFLIAPTSLTTSSISKQSQFSNQDTSITNPTTIETRVQPAVINTIPRNNVSYVLKSIPNLTATTNIVNSQQQQQQQQQSHSRASAENSQLDDTILDPAASLDPSSQLDSIYLSPNNSSSSIAFTTAASNPTNNLIINQLQQQQRQNTKWTPTQSINLLLAKYHPQMIVFSCACLMFLGLAFVIGSCRNSRSSRNSRNSSSSSTGKNSASCSAKSFNSISNNSSTGTGTTVAAGNQSSLVAAATAHHLKHNSCSESCFSLDDCHMPGSSNHSPALDSVEGRFIHQQQQPHQQHQHQQPHQVRPKLWSIYGSHEQAQQHMRNTLRPNRTFLGPQQQFQQEQPQHQQQQHLQHINNQQNELLLALAVNHQQQQQQQAAAVAAANNWCATLQHQQQQFQPKHFSVIPPPPPNLQLELSQTNDLVIPIHQQQQQQQASQQQQQLQLQQVAQLGQPYLGLAHHQIDEPRT